MPVSSTGARLRLSSASPKDLGFLIFVTQTLPEDAEHLATFPDLEMFVRIRPPYALLSEGLSVAPLQVTDNRLFTTRYTGHRMIRASLLLQPPVNRRYRDVRPPRAQMVRQPRM